MSNYTTTVITGWETRSKKKAKRAEIWCSNYGLKRLLKNLFIGKLYLREKEALTMNLEKLFSKKTDNVVVSSMCRTCHANLAPKIQEKAKKLPDFEILTDE